MGDLNYDNNRINETSYEDLIEIQKKCLINAKQFKYKKNANFMLRNNTITMNKEIQEKRRSSNATNRLSCEELEDLKERFVDFIRYDSPNTATTEDSSNYSACTNDTTKIKCSQQNKNLSHIKMNLKSRPEPPERTVSIRNSTIYSHGSYAPSNEMLTAEDTFKIKSTYSNIYNNTSSSCASSTTSSSSSVSTNSMNGSSSQPLRSFKSVYSINEENSYFMIKTERMIENDIKKIQSMYQSVNCIILVSSCTIDFYTTNSEQIANLQECWKMELNGVVPVWIFDRSYRRQKDKCLKLLFVDKTTGFPVHKEILITKLSQFKNPKDRRLTFTVENFICLINFHDYFSCNEFYKFFLELQVYLYESSMKNCLETNNFKATMNRIRSKSKDILGRKSQSALQIPLIKFTDDTDISKIKKNCISAPCAFQHINSLKNEDINIRMLTLDNKKLK